MSGLSSKADQQLELLALKSSADANKSRYNFDKPDPKVLERFDNPSGGRRIEVNIEAPEFTSLCPITNQPDFATIRVRYLPNEWCVESKSFKLYLMGFRNYGTFHEACVERIGYDLWELLEPEFLEVRGDFTPRGGISFHPNYHRDRLIDRDE
jgi:7-cyano-7-deazaguanine reductase